MDRFMLKASALGAMTSVTALETLRLICEEPNRSWSARGLAQRLGRDEDEVRNALERLVAVGMASVGRGTGLARLYRLTPSRQVWEFAAEFVRSFATGDDYSQEFVAAVALNVRERSARPDAPCPSASAA